MLCLPASAWQSLWEKKQEIDGCVTKMKKREPVLYRLELPGDIVVEVRSGSYCVEMRKYRESTSSGEMIATSQGVALKFSEWESLMRLSKNINRLLIGM